MPGTRPLTRCGLRRCGSMRLGMGKSTICWRVSCINNSLRDSNWDDLPRFLAAFSVLERFPGVLGGIFTEGMVANGSVGRKGGDLMTSVLFILIGLVLWGIIGGWLGIIVVVVCLLASIAWFALEERDWEE